MMPTFNTPHFACLWARENAQGPFSGYCVNFGVRSKIRVGFDTAHRAWLWSYVPNLMPAKMEPQSEMAHAAEMMPKSA